VHHRKVDFPETVSNSRINQGGIRLIGALTREP
jgi:hypothetical protein